MKRDRPDIPKSYGIEDSPEGMLEWSAVSAAIGASKTYWISTVRGKFASHLIPIWGGWDGKNVHIEGGDDTMWARNLAEHGNVSVGADHEGMQAILHGTAAKGTAARFDLIVENYSSKYPYTPIDPEFWIIQPKTVLAWETTTMTSFATTPTRFRFEENA